MKIDHIPLTKNGKIDTNALPEIEVQSSKEYVEPQSELEKKVADLYADILDVERVGMLDDFFELGGHSLKATLFVNRIEELVGRRISVRDLFAHSVVKDLCEFLSGENDDESTYSPIKAVEKQDSYAASYSQRRLYVMDQIDETGVAYNMPAAFRVIGDFDIDRANYAFKEIVRRHEVLRTSFALIDDTEPVQIVHDSVDTGIEYYDYSGKEVASAEEVVSGFVRHFELDRAPLIRVTVVKMAESDHILLFDIHHIVSDGVSLQLIIREFNDLYAGKRLDDVRLQYKDYSEWQHTQDMRRQEEFWLSQFEGEIPVLNLPLDYPRPLIQKFEGAYVSRAVPGELCEEIASFCMERKITPYMLFLSSAMIMLAKYSMQDDIIVGSTVSGRTHKDTEHMLGMFVNTVALRGFPQADKTCSTFLEEIHQLSLKLYENQNYPFEKLIEQLKLERSSSRNPLFDVMFTFQNVGDFSLDIDNASFQRLPQLNAAKFDLTINVENHGNSFVINFEYSTAVFKQTTMDIMIGHYLGILESVIREPDSAIGKITYLSEAEREKLIHEFNRTKMPIPDTTFRDLFEEQVRSNPEKTAVIYGDISLTYGELDRRANFIAQRLVEAGVKVGDFVALLASRTVETVIGILSIVKSGGAYVPIDPQYPESRISYIIEDCEPKFLLVGKEDEERSSGFAVPKIVIEDASNTEEVSDTYERSAIMPHDLLYVIYTSGTTGKPKGTLIENIGVVNLWEYYVNCQEVTSKDIVMEFASFAFDVSVAEMSMSLLTGATLCIVPDAIRQDPRDLSAYCNEHGVTIGVFPPQYLAQVDNLHFRTVMSAGSPTSTEIVSANNKSSVYSNDYGPTEVTVYATYWKNAPGADVPYRVPIGRPMNNKQTYILDNNGELCGINILGELCVAGVGLARGYLHQAALTDEKFTGNSFGKGKLYHTGDLARMLPDGNIEFWGRMDDQVKIRGYRVELNEVENTLKLLDGVQDAAVIVAKDDSGDDAICAYIVSDDTQSMSHIKEGLGEYLPDYMIPSYMVQLDKLPMNKNGKLDKRALPKIDMVSEREYVAPKSGYEQIVAEIFSEVLGVETVGATDDFFELGGHSLKANKLISSIEARTGIRLGLTKIFSSSTVSAIANEIEKEVKIRRAGNIERKYEKKTLNCIQERICFLSELARGSVTNNVIRTEVTGNLDLNHFKENTAALVKKLDILRSSFVQENGRFVQKVYESVEFNLEVVDFRAYEPGE